MRLFVVLAATRALAQDTYEPSTHTYAPTTLTYVPTSETYVPSTLPTFVIPTDLYDATSEPGQIELTPAYPAGTYPKVPAVTFPPPDAPGFLDQSWRQATTYNIYAGGGVNI